MSILRTYDPFFNSLFNFEPVFNPAEGVKTYHDKEKEEHFVWIEAPGFKEDEITIELKDNKLLISGELKDEEVQKKVGDKNFSYNIYQKGINEKSIGATLSNGILEVKFKLSGEKLLKKIPVKALTA